ncbi:MAG: site-specific integrase [Magnetococcales bacterium]|nr:site-specific integrase [Magnetococcales bacterium]
MTLQEALDRYIEEISLKKSPQGHDRDVRLARIILDRMDPEQPLIDVSPLVLDRYREQRLKEASPTTVSKDTELLRDLFRVALAHWNLPLEGNPVHALAEHGPGPDRTTRLAPGERLRLVAACDHYTNPILGLVVRIVLETGLRKGEILALKCDAVDPRRRICHVPRLQRNAPRQLPLTRTAVLLFQRALDLEDRPEETEWIFYGEPSRFGDRKPYALDRVFKKVTAKARLKRIAFDDLRSEAIATMAEAGLTEGEIAAITGVRQIRISRKAPEYQIERLLQRLDALFPESSPPPPIASEEVDDTEPLPPEKKRKPINRRTGGGFGQPKKY